MNTDALTAIEQALQAAGWEIECQSCADCEAGRILAVKGKKRWLVQVVEEAKG